MIKKALWVQTQNRSLEYKQSQTFSVFVNTSVFLCVSKHLHGNDISEQNGRFCVFTKKKEEKNIFPLLLALKVIKWSHYYSNTQHPFVFFHNDIWSTITIPPGASQGYIVQGEKQSRCFTADHAWQSFSYCVCWETWMKSPRVHVLIPKSAVG